ncbi:hypothetical protein N7474_000934 [Penicillium riverlandense]|uniref:uncharacterized protein n=1 Tax=Penicillium riverlandense TaxID=1903569 RepID=UPI002546D2F7|nr:uncharacterized protein N7474_000934 [Penicillium riverlandense]KAJ5832623.1 hypothetical protein N7474_000934 [Penicillium riverlandense]
MSGEKIFEGIFATHKPQGVTSADVVRKVQQHFQPSKTFKPWLDSEKARRDRESNFQQKRRRNKRLEIKVGHGGTLDPLATGVLVIGVGKGTKSLGDFLGCTKAYEATILFGAETDTYDRLGKITRRAPYEHVTREAVEKALDQFRGKIMQKPPIFSALRIDGKKLYEYAREGKVPDVEIKARPVETLDIKIMEWYEPGTHDYKWPEEEMVGKERAAAEQLIDRVDALPATAEGETTSDASATKRKSSPPNEESTDAKKVKVSETEAADAPKDPEPATGETTSAQSEQSRPQPAAVKISMTVTSGFYVRSLAHDLGKAVGSCALMSELVRTRQGDYELAPEKTLEYKDFEAGEEVWGPKVQGFLEKWNRNRLDKLEAEK